MDEIYLCGHSQTERFCYNWIEIIVVALASRHCSEVLFSSYLFTLSTSHTVCVVIVWENPFWLKWMLTKQHFISFPICEKFVTSRYKIPGRLKGFKRKHIVLGVCLFLSVNFFLSTLKNHVCLFLYQNMHDFIPTSFFFSQDSLKNQILALKRLPQTILGMQEKNVWLTFFCWFAPASGFSNNCTL